LLPTIGKWPAISAAERQAGIAQCDLSKLTGKLTEEEQQLSAAVMIGGNSYKATIDTGATASFVSEEMADIIAALGRIIRTRRQIRLADGRSGGINAQLELKVKFDNKQVTMSLLILPGVVDPLVLGWNFLKQVGTEIRCAGHEIIIPARNRHNEWLEEKLSVAVVQQVNELDDTTAFLEAELADFSTMTGTSNMAEHQIKIMDDKPIKQRYYPNNPRGNQRKGGRASPNGVHRAFKEPIQLPHRDGEREERQVETLCRLQTDQRVVSEGCPLNAPHKLHPRSTKGSAVHQQFGKEG